MDSWGREGRVEEVKIEMRKHISCMVDLEGLGFDGKWKEEIKAISYQITLDPLLPRKQILGEKFSRFFPDHR